MFDIQKQHGEMAEWLNAAVSKTVVGYGSPGVRISLSPQGFAERQQRKGARVVE